MCWTAKTSLTSPKWGVGLNPHRLQTFLWHWVHRLWLGASRVPVFSSTWHSGQVWPASGGGGAQVFSSCSEEMALGGFLDLAGGVSGAESESGGDPGGEKGESGGEPGPESAGESGGDPGGESAASAPSPVTILVAELKREDPKLNI